MNRSTQVTIIILLLIVVGFGVLLTSKKRATKQPTEPAGEANHLVVFAPCGMSSPITSAKLAFTKAYPNTTVDIHFDSAPILVDKVKNGERPDVFMTPGELEIRHLNEGNYLDRSTIRDFATLDMVVIAPKSSSTVKNLDDLANPKIRISIADPARNSSGYYGEKALRSLKLWDKTKNHMLVNPSPLAAVEIVTTGKVEAGITYFTCPLDTSPDKADKGSVRFIKIPRGSYPRIRCQMAIMKDTTNRKLAQQFIDFMQTDAAQDLIATDGLLRVKE